MPLLTRIKQKNPIICCSKLTSSKVVPNLGDQQVKVQRYIKCKPGKQENRTRPSCQISLEGWKTINNQHKHWLKWFKKARTLSEWKGRLWLPKGERKKKIDEKEIESSFKPTINCNISLFLRGKIMDYRTHKQPNDSYKLILTVSLIYKKLETERAS